MAETRNAWLILFGKPYRKKSLVTLISRWENNIKIETNCDDVNWVAIA
jgi:hypothetical protein